MKYDTFLLRYIFRNAVVTMAVLCFTIFESYELIANKV